MGFTVLTGEVVSQGESTPINKSGHEIDGTWLVLNTGMLSSERVSVRTSTITVLNEENHARLLPAAAGGVAFGASGAVVGAILAGSKNFKIILVENGETKFVAKVSNKDFTRIVASQAAGADAKSGLAGFNEANEGAWWHIGIVAMVGFALLSVPFQIVATEAEYPVTSSIFAIAMGGGALAYAWSMISKKREKGGRT